MEAFQIMTINRQSWWLGGYERLSQGTRSTFEITTMRIHVCIVQSYWSHEFKIFLQIDKNEALCLLVLLGYHDKNLSGTAKHILAQPSRCAYWCFSASEEWILVSVRCRKCLYLSNFTSSLAKLEHILAATPPAILGKFPEIYQNLPWFVFITKRV